MSMVFRMMKFSLFWVFMAVFLIACNQEDQYIPPYATYDAPLVEDAKIEQIEARLRSIAVRGKWKIFEKDRGEMSVISSGEPAFFIFYYYKKKPVLVVGNAGASAVLRIDAFGCGELPVEELNKLIAEVIESLEGLGLKFKKMN